MSPILFWVAIGVALIIAVILIVTLLLPSDASRKEAPSADVSINAAEGSIVTVRKVGHTTRVVIRSDIHDHWEGSDGIDLSPAPIEITRNEEPQLYAEYMSPKTSAIRKYEIADYIYSIGLTLPYIHGLHEQWQKELQKDGTTIPSGEINPATEHTPVNLKGGAARGGVVYNKLDINHRLRREPMVDLESVEDPQETPAEPSENESENENTDV